LPTDDERLASSRSSDDIARMKSPGEPPVRTPDKFERTVDLKTVRARGLIIPPTLLARADEATSRRYDVCFCFDPEQTFGASLGEQSQQQQN
jgi:hypothetical protein